MSFEAKAWKETEGPFLKDFNEKEAIDSVNGALAADLMDPVHQLHHLLGVAGDRGVDYHALVGEALVAGGEELCGVLHEHGQLGPAPHVDLYLDMATTPIY